MGRRAAANGIFLTISRVQVLSRRAREAKLCHGVTPGTFTFARNVYAEQRGNFLEVERCAGNCAAAVADVVCTGGEWEGGREEGERRAE